MVIMQVIEHRVKTLGAVANAGNWLASTRPSQHQLELPSRRVARVWEDIAQSTRAGPLDSRIIALKHPPGIVLVQIPV